MWIKMLTDQVGPNGIFLAGQLHSLPAETVARLDPKSYVEVAMDETRFEQMNVRQRIAQLETELSANAHAANELKNRLKTVQSDRKRIVERLRAEQQRLAGLNKTKETDNEGKGKKKLQRPAGPAEGRRSA